MRRLLSYLRRAVDDYDMLAPGDRVAVGVSGGKDSLALLCALKALQRFYPHPFELEAITLDLGIAGMDFSPVAALCSRLDIPYSIHKTDIYEVVFEVRRESNPCALCANMRRGALNGIAKERGCTKVALGHHFDDVIETFLLSLFYEGRVGCFSPVTYLERVDITAIRPLLYVPEAYITAFAAREKLPVVENPCPADGNTKREYIKATLRQLEHDNRGLRERLFTALQHSVEGWEPSPKPRKKKTAEQGGAGE